MAADVVSLPGVTVIGNLNAESVGVMGVLGQLFGGGIATVAFTTGAVGTMSLADAIALGMLFGGIAAIGLLGIAVTGIALAAVISANINSDSPTLGPGVVGGGGDGGGGGGD